MSSRIVKNITIDSPLPSCPVASNTFDKPGAGPITGFPSGTETSRVIVFVNSKERYTIKVVLLEV